MLLLLLHQRPLCNNSIVFSLSLNWCLHCTNLLFFFVFCWLLLIRSLSAISNHQCFFSFFCFFMKFIMVKNWEKKKSKWWFSLDRLFHCICCILASNCDCRKTWNRVTILGIVTRLDWQRGWSFEMENRDTIWEIVTRFNSFLTKFPWKGLVTTVVQRQSQHDWTKSWHDFGLLWLVFKWFLQIFWRELKLEA